MMTNPRSPLIRAALALLLILSQGQVFAHGLDHIGDEDSNPVCATCVAGHNLSASNHDYWALILPLAQGFRDCCHRCTSVRALKIRTVFARAPPA